VREEHLKGRKEIKEVFGKGKRYGCQGAAKLFVLKNNLTYNRICFTFAKTKNKSWNAVARNRAKRVNREAFRLTKARFSGGHDLILLSYPDYFLENGSLSREQFVSLFTKAGLFK